MNLHTINGHDIPERIRMLPRDHRGYPVPWFVHRDADGKHDFRVIGAGKIEQAIRRDICWICGGPLARNKAFVIGPLAAIARYHGEAPSHRSCAQFAAEVCPFLSKPRMRRNDRDMPAEAQKLPGMVLHNPGVCAVWTTRAFRIVPVDNGVLFHLNDPVDVMWFSQGKPATRGEVVQAMDRGLAIMIDEAREDSEQAVQALLQAIARMRQYLPKGGKDDEPGQAAKRHANAA